MAELRSDQSKMTAENYRRMHPYCWRCGYMFQRDPVVPCRCGAMEESGPLATGEEAR